MYATSTNSVFATVGASDSTVMGVNLGRRFLTVSPPTAGRVTLAFGRAAVIDQGPTVQAGTQPLTIAVEQFGDLLMGEIHAIADAAGRTVGLTEAFVARP